MLGVSLGGHAAWQVLFNEPRVTAAVVIIGCPDYMRKFLISYYTIYNQIALLSQSAIEFPDLQSFSVKEHKIMVLSHHEQTFNSFGVKD